MRWWQQPIKVTVHSETHVVMSILQIHGLVDFAFQDCRIIHAQVPTVVSEFIQNCALNLVVTEETSLRELNERTFIVHALGVVGYKWIFVSINIIVLLVSRITHLGISSISRIIDAF